MMETWFLVVFNLICLTLTQCQGQKKVCFAPVACATGDVSSSEWMEIVSPSQVSKSQCTSRHSEETITTQTEIPESRIKSLISESVAKFRSELTNLLATKGDSDELKRLQNDVKEMNQTLNQKNTRLEKELTKIHETLHLLNDSQKPKPACPHVGNITYNNKCYWLIIHAFADITFAQAETLCSQGGGIPGDILSQAHYDLVKAKCREMTSSLTYFWLGMNINPSTKDVTLSDGTGAPFTKWFPGWPQSTAAFTKLSIQLSEPSPDGMFHRSPTTTNYGVLCQG